MNINSTPPDVTTQGYNFDPSIFAKFEKAMSQAEDSSEGGAPPLTGEQIKKHVVDSKGKAVTPVGISDSQSNQAVSATASSASPGVALDAQGNKVAVVSTVMQDVIEEASTAMDKFSSAYVSGTNQSLILNNPADTPTLVAPTGTGALPTGSKGHGNPFLTASFVVALIEVMAELIKVQSQQRLVETKLDIMSNQWTIDLAKRMASDIMQSAKTEAMMHYMLAASAGVQLGMAVANGAMGALAMKKSIGDYNKQTKALQTKFDELNAPAKSRAPGSDAKVGTEDQLMKAKFKLDEHRANKWSNISTSFRMRMFPMDTAKDITDSTSKMYENIVQGIMKVKKAEYDADIKLAEGYQEIARKIGADASASLKDIEDKVKSIAEAVQQMITKLYSAFNYRIH
ncbi:putative uncharacterized protein [Parachlamydia acanthamoebae UV-7]|jgi:hypothetical protein|uniref:Uncharacterized protein n=2 Tax=Parachlamydia acanthamoebae TaxID=83552 RepID=F8KX14_PARAV|nr:hypothetical protein [Parachlamydia acanthamoebae]CCB85481.1 putative uncharacterized protein [Parachlamydia acanthamoebae UV-7]